VADRRMGEPRPQNARAGSASSSTPGDDPRTPAAGSRTGEPRSQKARAGSDSLSSPGDDLRTPAGLSGDLEAARAVAAGFDPGRLTLARERAKLAKKDLAEAVGVTPTAITQFERRLARPAPETVVRLASVLGLPVGYFAAGRAIMPIEESGTHFRSLRSTRVAERTQARATMSHLAELVGELERVVRLPDLDVPEIEAAPETAAVEVRRAWRVPHGPFHHLLRTLESKGVVISMARFGSGERIDAFTCRAEELSRPLVCLTKDRGNPLRRRFSAAHELGHLVLHGGSAVAPGSARQEQEADKFAAELLMPARDLEPLLPTRLDLAYLFEVQKVWGVSVHALLRRSHDLGVIGESLYRRGMVTLGQLGWRRTEPTGTHPTEWPSLLAEAVELASARGVTEQSLAADLCLPLGEVRELLSRTVDERPSLRLVPESSSSGQTAL
jgi:Zn-dependent peptidase ImmA (M78 family)/transcriptional regulator with XRE-family HTH domain